MIQPRFYVDDRGFRTAEVPSPYQAFGTYLESDVQSLEHVLKLLDRTREVISGARPSWDEGGNAFRVYIRPDRVRLECEFDENLKGELSTEDYLELLKGWSEFLGPDPKELRRLEQLAARLRDPHARIEDRTAAIPDLCSQDKRWAFPILVELLTSPDPTLTRAAITQSPRLKDSRLLFTLINVFERLDLDSSEDLRTGLAILECLATLRDPRSGGWLKECTASSNEALARAARAAIASCDPGRLDFAYTYIGSDQDFVRNWKGGITPRVPLRESTSLRDPTLTRFLRDERHGDLSYALFVVLPGNANAPFSSGCHMGLAPWRTEHYLAAYGRDVLSAGVVGIRDAAIEEISNQSGGFYPSSGSFEWVRRALEGAHIPFSLSAFTQEWPPEGYDSKGVRSRFPLFE